MRHNFPNGIKIAAVVAFLTGTAAAFATERTINQQGKVFSESEVSIKTGDTLVFLNDDTVVHNVISISPGNQFNLGSIKPGVSTPVTFKNAGTVQIICAIHPSMKMTVQITD
jgi:plastocyanin